MIAPADLEHCRDVIRTGSLSFHAASKLLPASVRDPALALYAFCRLADDEVDEGFEKGRAVIELQERLDLAYAGTPKNAPEDRAFAAIIAEFDMPRALPEALLEGLAWDAVERRYHTLSDVRMYSSRVASAVGAMMCVLMRVREPHALARACDLGVAMQLTNIARDVGEDARAGRIYLPLDWLEEEGIALDAFFAAPEASPEIRRMVRRLLSEARRLYIRSEAGIGALPVSARTGIFAARYIYEGIGGALRRNNHDSISFRARTTKAQKIKLIGKAGLRAAASIALPRSPVIFAKPLPEVAFLVDATASRNPVMPTRMEGLMEVMAVLRARELANGRTQGVAAE
ncbi:15-cis-phytoene synthase [Sulfitobacter guttiformis]|uniref:Phytoene synthase n=1 Tax=Sulfitobacter guttiformis TaxID=74349 RepID=J7G0L7_9RHOB|nr:phytoene/squalene synthase family protein [Sulfitobacter guttiformis]AFP55507.1 phytoene synthase [Sulfitobacter guttiformis]KIN75476.1 Phytoene synthase [Sulfitobacter guttiformis KCTC 32187]RKE92130.1 phytoene synthase [Sulfitobacter guttiformis]